MRTFKIEINFDKDGHGHVLSSDIHLDEYQIITLESFPPYYDNLILLGYVDGHHLCVETCLGNMSKLTSEQFDELVYESNYCGDEWLINRIEIDMDKILDFFKLEEKEQEKIKELYNNYQNIQLLETIFGKDFTDDSPKTWSELVRTFYQS